MIYERLEGWWFKKAIDALCCDMPVFVNQNQVRSFIVSVSQEYADDNLPIDILDIDDLQEDNFSANEKIFHEQLKLICLGNHRMQLALRDYYRAFRQRASWVRKKTDWNEVNKIYQFVIDRTTELQGQLQVIIVDHADLKKDSFREFIRENWWPDDKNLVPIDWYKSE